MDITVGPDVLPGVYSYAASIQGSSERAVWTVTVVSVSVVPDLPMPTTLGTGGSALLPVRLLLPSGAPASGVEVRASSTGSALLAGVSGVSGADGRLELAVEAASADVGMEGVDVVVELRSSGLLIGGVDVKVVPGLSAVEVEGSLDRAGSSMLPLVLKDSMGRPLAGRPVSFAQPLPWRDSGMFEISTQGQPCADPASGLCTGAAGDVMLTVATALEAPSALSLDVTVDGVTRRVSVQVLP